MPRLVSFQNESSCASFILHDDFLNIYVTEREDRPAFFININTSPHLPRPHPSSLLYYGIFNMRLKSAKEKDSKKINENLIEPT